jgi:cell division protein FtsA
MVIRGRCRGNAARDAQDQVMGDNHRIRSNVKQNGMKTAIPRNGVIAALDVGSSKIACIIGRAEHGGIRVLGSALRESRGIRSGTIVNIDQAEQSIGETVEAAEEFADHRIQDVVLSVQCGQPKSVHGRAEATAAGVVIGDEHLRILLANAKHRCREAGFETVQAAPTEYVVDQTRGVADPRNMVCDRLGVSVHAVAVRAAPLQNLRLAVQRRQLVVSRQLFAPYASAIATLTPDELSLGCTLIDMGAGCTSICVFRENSLVHGDMIPLGGANLTADIAFMLSTPVTAAERMKTLYGSALGELDAGDDLIEVPLVGEEAERSNRVRRAHVAKIIRARIDDIFGTIHSRLAKAGFDVAAGRRAVLTGGASQLAGVREVASEILKKQVRLGRPQTFPGLAVANAGPAYATAIGLLIAAATTSAESTDPDPPAVAQPPRAGFARWVAQRFLG